MRNKSLIFVLVLSVNILFYFNVPFFIIFAVGYHFFVLLFRLFSFSFYLVIYLAFPFSFLLVFFIYLSTFFLVLILVLTLFSSFPVYVLQFFLSSLALHFQLVLLCPFLFL